MTAAEAAYIFDVKASFTEFASDLAYKYRGGIGKERPYLNVQLVYLEGFIDIIFEYFSTPNSMKDENFATPAQIETLQNRINNIMGTSHWLELI